MTAQCAADHHPPSRPEVLGNRADSPMSEGSATVIDDSQVNGGHAAGRPFPRPEPATTGFTAVNGDARMRAGPAREDAAERSVASPATDPSHARGPFPPQFHSHGWRPDTQPPMDKRGEHADRHDAPHKRKRSASREGDRDADRHANRSSRAEKPRLSINPDHEPPAASHIRSPRHSIRSGISPRDGKQSEPTSMGSYAR